MADDRLVSVKEKWAGAQTMFKIANQYACHFMTLLSIAEEERIRQKRSNSNVDFLEATRVAKKSKTSDGKPWMDNDFTVTVEGSLKLLELYTDKKWERREVKTLPPSIKDNEYTEVIHYNERTKFKHYHRRGIDTLDNSITVAEGKIIGYYIYTCKD